MKSLHLIIFLTIAASLVSPKDECAKFLNEHYKAHAPFDPEPGVNTFINQVAENSTADSTKYFYDLLMRAELIEPSYPIEGLLSFKVFRLPDKNLSIIQLEYNEGSRYWGEDPVYHLLILHTNTGIQCYYVEPSAYPNDVKLIFHNEKLIAFKSYNSPVGFSRLLVYSVNDGLILKSERVSENESILSKTIDADQRKFLTLDRSNYIKKHLSFEPWKHCY